MSSRPLAGMAGPGLRRREAKPGRVTVPHPERDIPVGTLRSIEKQSGLKLRQ